MNAKTLIAAAALAIVGTSAFANEVTEFQPQSTLTRAEVLADLARARANGTLDSHGESYGVVAPATVVAGNARGNVTTLSRVEVRGTVDRAIASGYVVAGEAYGSVEPSSVRSREDVRAETVAALRTRHFGERSDI